MSEDESPAEAPTPSPQLQREAADRLSRIHGTGELHAVLLALLLPPGSKRAVRAWQLETQSTPGAEALRGHAANLSSAARLPWFETLLARMAGQAPESRHALLQASRRVMGARGIARPIDRLHWLALRRAFGDGARHAARQEAHAETSAWLESDVLSVAAVTAFLSRMVPGEIADSLEGEGWYRGVMTTWLPFDSIPAWQAPTAEAMVEALARVQTLSWIQRPVIVRTWVSTAITRSRGHRLSELSADALRLTCGLLDSPLPPELSRQYITLAPDNAM